MRKNNIFGFSRIIVAQWVVDRCSPSSLLNFFRVALNSYEAQQRRFSLGSEMFNFRRVTPFILRPRPLARSRHLNRRIDLSTAAAAEAEERRREREDGFKLGELKTVAAAAAAHARQTDKMGCPRGQPARLRPRRPRAHLRIEEGQPTWLKKKSGAAMAAAMAAAAQEKSHGRFNERTNEATPTFLRTGKMPTIRGM